MSLQPRLAVPLLALLSIVLAPAASAGTSEDPEIADAAGDAGPNNAAAPAGAEWADIGAAWFEEETADAITLKIALAKAPPANPPSEYTIGVQVGTHDMIFLIGWGVFARQGSGYVCEADSQGNPTVCTGLSGASFSNGIYTIPAVPRASIHAENASTVLTDLSAYAGLVPGTPEGSPVAYGQFVPYDSAAGVRDYVFTLGKNAKNGTAETLVPIEVDSPPLEQAVTAADDEAETNEAPGVGIALAIALAATAALGLASIARRK